jgi:hypothetical protein
MWCSAPTAQSTQRPRQSSSENLQKVPFPRLVMLLNCHFHGQSHVARAQMNPALAGEIQLLVVIMRRGGRLLRRYPHHYRDRQHPPNHPFGPALERPWLSWAGTDRSSECQFE